MNSKSLTPWDVIVLSVHWAIAFQGRIRIILSTWNTLRRDYTLPTLLHRVSRMERIIPNAGKLWDAIACLSHCYIAFQVNSKWFLACNFKWMHQWFPCTIAPQHLFYLILIKSIPNWFNIKPTLRSKWRRQSTYRYIYILREQPEKRTNTEKFLALHWNNLYVANLVIY